ncbi:phage tail tube protein [Nocardioides montaniterrae]
MADTLRPDPTKVYERENWVFVPTFADYTTPLATEAIAASALDITRIAFAENGPAPDQSTELVSQNKRYGDGRIFQFVGDTTYSGGDMFYQFAPQAAAGSDGKKAYEKFLNTSGTITGFLMRRQGVPRATTITAGQFVDVYPVEFGPSLPTKVGDGAAAEAAAKCTYAITGAPALNKALG